jgi:IS1 family transposase/transposase-like protein
MTCHSCKTQCKRFGKDRKGCQGYRCCQYYKTHSERPEKLDGTYLPTGKITQILQLLVEGCSVRSIERITGTHRDTILNLLALAGDRCERLLEKKIHNRSVTDVQCDELWGFVGCKEKHNRTGNPQFGDAYCFVAIERNNKLILTWHLGRRTARDTVEFVEKLDAATGGKFQITTDGFFPYFDAIHTALGVRVDYAQLIKAFESSADDEHRYSPPQVTEAIAKPMWGNPDPERICTSHIERQNLTMRMQIRRLTRLTNAFSKKWENLKAALALYFPWYNFCRIHRALRLTPAMEAGIADHIWSITELLEAA